MLHSSEAPARRLAPERLEPVIALAETLVAQAEGEVTPEARRHVAQAAAEAGVPVRACIYAAHDESNQLGYTRHFLWKARSRPYRDQFQR